MVSTDSRSERNAPSVASSSKASPCSQIVVRGEVVAQAQLAGRGAVQPLVEAQKHGIAGATGVAQRGQQPLVEQLEAGAAQRVAAAHELVRERGRQAAAVPLEPRQEPPHRSAAHLDAEVGGGDVLEVVGLVEHETAVGRQDRRLFPVVLRLPDREVGRQQMVVHHHHVRLRRPPPRAEEEAAVEEAALEPRTQVGLRAHLVPHFVRGRDRQVAERAVRRVTGPFGDADQLVELVLLEQGSLGRHRLVHPREAEVVPPPLEQRERRRVALPAQGPTQERKVLADQLFLQVDGVRAHHGALAVDPRPVEGGHEVGERLSDACARLQQLHAAVVVPVGDVGGHVALAAPVLVLAELPRHRAALAQSVDHVERVDPEHRAIVRHLDHDVELGGSVVDDAEAHPAVVEAGRDVEVGRRRIEPAARMVVQQHLAPLGHAREGEHHVDRAPRHHACARHHAVAVHLGHERHFASAGRDDLAGEIRADARGDSLGEVDAHAGPCGSGEIGPESP